MMFWYGSGGWAFWQVALMWVVMIGFWSLLIWGAYALITGASRRPGQAAGSGEQRGDSARRILDERLARGEIGADEYEHLRDVLTAGQGRRPAGTGSDR